ncbi:MAG: glycosyltransferase family 2 protein [Nostocaceae cyanobacterium]|nr:glycosyltransferase family 2 protein [Nostocaceae cyanobacterium]
MMIFVQITLLIISLIIIIPILVLFVECCAALLPSRTTAKATITSRPKVAVLVPAHNEASGITTTLETLLPQLTPEDRLVVIADNCTDDTATISRGLGAEVIERKDLENRGKGYALDYGLQFIATEPPEVVFVIDADCYVHQGTIDSMAKLAKACGRTIQAINLLAQPAQPSARDRVSTLAFMVNTLVRPTGLLQLGLPSPLQGTGMAFPWSVINQISLASGNIVEDMQLGVNLAIAGHTALFCLDGKVTGILPQQEGGAKNQRTRWEHGHIKTLLTQVPLLLKESVIQRRLDLLAMALDLFIPPLSLLVLMWLGVMTGALILGIWGGAWIPAIILGFVGFLMFVSIFGAWFKFGRAELPLKTLLAVPFYLLWKIPIYLAFLVRPQKEWIRTERD